MRIIVNTENKCHRIWIPSFILNLKFIWQIGAKKAGFNELDKESIKKISKEFKKVHRYFKGLELVRVESVDSTKVIIRL